MQNLVIQASDLVFQMQLFSLYFSERERIDTRLLQRFLKLLLKDFVAALQFRQMRFNSHQ